MQCRDAQFYLRLRRHAGDELGTDVTADLDRHVAACPACATDSRAAAIFDRTVARAMIAIPVPSGLRDRLLNQMSTHRGGVIRRKAYQVAALAASVFFTAGLAFGVFSASRPKIDTGAMVMTGDEVIQDPESALRRWLAAQKFPERLPEAFDHELLMSLGKEEIQGKDIPVAVFRHPSERGFAKVYLFRTDGTYNLKDLQDAGASHTMVKVISAEHQYRGVTYVILHTMHPVNPGENPLKPFLRRTQDIAGLRG